MSEALDTLDAAVVPVRDEETDRLIRLARSRWADAECSVAFLGEWSRGKSSLINALIGRDLLPTDVRPTTASLVTVRHGVGESASLVGTDGSRTLLPLEGHALRHAQTRETGGQGSAARVDCTLPLPGLAGLVLIDTPGVNDLGALHRDVLYRVLPAVDLIVVVLDGTNGGMSRTEEEFLRARLLGDLQPPIAVVVGHWDRVEAEDEEELEELQEEFAQAIEAVLGGGVPTVFGACAQAPETEATAEALRDVLRATAGEARRVRQARVIAGARRDLDAALASRVQRLGEDVAALAEQVDTVATARDHLGPALASFRAHVLRQGAAPLKALISQSLAEHARTTEADMLRRVGMAGDLAAYARHGLVADVEAASRLWSQRHLPEVATFLRRHLAFVRTEFQRGFGGVLGPELSFLRIQVPQQRALPDLDVEAVQERQQAAESSRYILPGVLTVLGSLIAAPVGIVGLYVGLQVAQGKQRAATEAIRSDLSESARALVAADLRRTESSLHDAVDAYFADLDRQLERVFARLIEDRAAQLREAEAAAAAGAQARDTQVARLQAARQALSAG